MLCAELSLLYNHKTVEQDCSCFYSILNKQGRCSDNISFHLVDIINDFGQNGGFDVLFKRFDDDLKSEGELKWKYYDANCEFIRCIAKVEYCI